jgi:uncharacterized protein (DUF302 family)
MADFAIRRILKTSFEEVLGRIPEALSSEGFGILTEIDVQDTLKKKLGADFRRYRILGACNPRLAHQALQAELEIGVMLPCNVIVFDAGDGETRVAAVDPERTLAVLGDPKLHEIAAEVRVRLARALERI